MIFKEANLILSKQFDTFAGNFRVSAMLSVELEPWDAENLDDALFRLLEKTAQQLENAEFAVKPTKREKK